MCSNTVISQEDESYNTNDKTSNYTLMLIKPDSINKGYLGNIISLIEENCFEIIALNMLHFNRELARNFYKIHAKKHFFDKLISFMTSDRTVAAILKKENAIRDLRDLAGDTNPLKAKKRTIRYLYGSDVTRNAIHSSDSIETADREIKCIFPNYKLST